MIISASLWSFSGSDLKPNRIESNLQKAPNIWLILNIMSVIWAPPIEVLCQLYEDTS